MQRHTPFLEWLAKHKQSILYGISLALLLFLLKWMEMRFVIINYAMEVYIGGIALIFTALGIWLALKLSRPRIETVFVEKEKTTVPHRFSPDKQALEESGLSKRELEVLQLMAEGLSNQEIAEKLFLSLNTIKTHSSRLFEKLEVERRTQAIDKAKRRNIIP